MRIYAIIPLLRGISVAFGGDGRATTATPGRRVWSGQSAFGTRTHCHYANFAARIEETSASSIHSPLTIVELDSVGRHAESVFADRQVAERRSHPELSDP